MKKLIVFLMTFMLLFTLSAFDLNAKPSNNPAPPIYFGEEREIIDNWQSYEFTLWAGQNIEAGTVIVWNDEETIFVRIISPGLIDDVHIYVYNDLSLIPNTRPAPGLAPYGQEDVYDHDVTIEIPMDEINDGDTFYLIVHVAFTAMDDETDEAILALADETAYAGNDDSEFTGRGAWFYVIGFTAKYHDDNGGGDDPILTSETAWAYGGAYALENKDYITGGQWGWTNGPLAEGSYLFDLYAGAGQNDLSKGTLVGSVQIEYAGGVATVTYTVFDEFLLGEVHLYVGNDVLPMLNSSYTAAPGQFPMIAEDLEVLTYEFVVEDLQGEIFVAAHAVVYGEYDE